MTHYKKRKPLISVITIVKNDEKKINKTIKSVLNQKFKNFEYIVIDGKSKDKTLKIVNRYKKKINKIVSRKDKNLWDAMNTGIRLSTGRIIGIINSGDVYYPQTLKFVSNYFKKFKNLDYLFGPVKKDRILFRFEPEKIYYRMNIYPSHSGGFFIKSKAQKQVGYYDKTLKFGADHDLFYKIIVKHKLKGMIAKKSEVFAKFDLGGISSKISFCKTYFYEMKIRYKNGQNIIYLIVLYLLKIINKVVKQFIRI